MKELWAEIILLSEGEGEIASRRGYDCSPDDGHPGGPRLSGESVLPLQYSRHRGEYNLVNTIYWHWHGLLFLMIMPSLVYLL